MTEFTWEVQQQHAELALAAYTGWSESDSGLEVGPARDRGNMPGLVEERYEVALQRSQNGEAVFSFTDRQSGEIFVVGRGTDAILDDGMQYIPGISDGVGTELGQLMAEVAEQIYKETGQQVTVIGHSYAGHAAEEAARLVAGAVLSATNFQGPSVVDRLVETPFSVERLFNLFSAFDTTPLGRLDSTVPVNRVGASEYDLSFLGFVQIVLDSIGAAYETPNNVTIPVGVHDMAMVNAYYNGLAHTLMFASTLGGFADHPNIEDRIWGLVEIYHQGSLSFSAAGFMEQAAEWGRRADALKQVLVTTRQQAEESQYEREKGYNDDPGDPDDKDDNPNVQPDYTGKNMPIILDLDGLGISVTELSQSTVFVDGGDGLEHRTAWAGAGDGVLFYDADGSGTISEQREYVFTEWDPTATTDLEALRSVFDTNGDGKLTSADSTWSQFRVAVTEPDGTLSYHTLAELGITEIDLMGDATNIELPDGSVITGQTTFTMNGQTHTVGEMTLATDGRGYRLEETESTSGGTTTRDIEAYGTGGELAWAIHGVGRGEQALESGRHFASHIIGEIRSANGQC